MVSFLSLSIRIPSTNVPLLLESCTKTSLPSFHFDVATNWQRLGEFGKHVLVLALRLSGVRHVNLHFELAPVFKGTVPAVWQEFAAIVTGTVKAGGVTPSLVEISCGNSKRVLSDSWARTSSQMSSISIFPCGLHASVPLFTVGIVEMEEVSTYIGTLATHFCPAFALSTTICALTLFAPDS